MTNEPSPRPWRITHPGEIEDANGNFLYNLRDCIGGGVDEANAALIVDAVNERDDLVENLKTAYQNRERENAEWVKFATALKDERDRLRDALERIVRYEDGIVGCIESGHASGIDWDGITFAMIQEARAALGAGETPTGKGVGV